MIYFPFRCKQRSYVIFIDGMCSVEVKGQNILASPIRKDQSKCLLCTAVVDIATGSNDELAEALGKQTIVKIQYFYTGRYSL